MFLLATSTAPFIFGPVRHGIMVLDLEILTHFLHHLVIQIGGIVCDNLPGQSIPENYFLFNEPDYHASCDSRVRGGFNPFGEVVMEKGHGAAKTFKGMGGALTLSVNVWHLWHFLTWMQQSLSMVSQ